MLHLGAPTVQVWTCNPQPRQSVRFDGIRSEKARAFSGRRRRRRDCRKEKNEKDSPARSSTRADESLVVRSIAACLHGSTYPCALAAACPTVLWSTDPPASRCPRPWRPARPSSSSLVLTNARFISSSSMCTEADDNPLSVCRDQPAEVQLSGESSREHRVSAGSPLSRRSCPAVQRSAAMRRLHSARAPTPIARRAPRPACASFN